MLGKVQRNGDCAKWNMTWKGSLRSAQIWCWVKIMVTNYTFDNTTNVKSVKMPKLGRKRNVGKKNVRGNVREHFLKKSRGRGTNKDSIGPLRSHTHSIYSRTSLTLAAFLPQKTHGMFHIFHFEFDMKPLLNAAFFFLSWCISTKFQWEICDANNHEFP